MAQAAKDTSTGKEIQKNTESLQENISSKFEDVKSTVSEKLGNAKTAVADTLGDSKTAVVDKMHQAADSLRERAVQSEGVEGKLASYEHRAADFLGNSADYINDFDPNQLKTDLQNQVKKNPGRSLLIAGAVGLILGALFQRNRRD